MAIAGNLRTMSQGDLLQWLSLAQKTGTLTVRNGLVEKKIFFKQGRILSSASNNPREYLGQFLMSHGFISEPELKKAMEVQQQSSMLLGKILVTIGVISEADLLRLMRVKAEEEIYDVFLWKAGEFYFEDDALPARAIVPLQVDITGILIEGVRRVDEWRRIRELLPSSALVPVLMAVIDREQLAEAERVIVSAIDGNRSIEEIVLESRSSEFAVSKLVHALVLEDAITIEAAKVVEEAPYTLLAEEQDVAAILDSAHSAAIARDYDRAVKQIKAAQLADPGNERIAAIHRTIDSLIASDLKASGISIAKIPRLKRNMDEISDMDFTPNEGFILSRINGMWDIGSIMKISPMREADALLIFHRLHRDGIVDFA